MAFINGKWVNEYDRGNWSFGPNGGQGLLNPDKKQVFWSGGTPSFQAPTQPNLNPTTGAFNPGGAGPAAPGWLGQQNQPQQQYGGQQGYNQLPSYNQNPTMGSGGGTRSLAGQGGTQGNDLQSYFPLSQYYSSQQGAFDPAGGTGRYSAPQNGQIGQSPGAFNYYDYAKQ